MRRNYDLVTAVQTLTVKSVYTAAGTYFLSLHSYHYQAPSPQSAVLSGFMVLGMGVTTHTHIYTHSVQIFLFHNPMSS